MKLIEGTQSAASIQQAWLAEQPSNEPLFFIGAQLTDPTELTLLYGWTQTRAPRLMLLVFSTGNVLLQHRDPRMMRYQWTPANSQLLP